ncbi:division/cell wall cluster transcriptional repressor MraZ [Spirochaetia bacterium]|nr:division/cell wall cluster transcriptional repressor MraZ [Spirochaetia bacterium]
MELKTGTAESTLDDKGRVSIPLRFRDRYQGELVITWGMQPSAWIMTPVMWERFSEKLTNSDLITEEERLLLEHRYINQAQAVDLDKAGRVAIPGIIRKYAKLTKECTVISAENHLEIWDTGFYFDYLEQNSAISQGAMNKMGSVRLFKLD